MGYVATSADMTSDLVGLDLPTRQWDDMKDPNVYVALDEGCNTTCHSEHWGNTAQNMLSKSAKRRARQKAVEQATSEGKTHQFGV